jgi:hypothetical protein
MSNNETGFQIVRNVAAGDTTNGFTATPAAGTTAVVIAVASSATQKTAINAARTYIDTTVVPGVTYYYTVASSAGTALSTPTATAPVTIADKTAIADPSAPTAVITNGTTITLAWTDLSTNETGFVVERAINGTWGALPLATVARTVTATKGVNGAVTYTDKLVAPVVYGTYQYRVTAVNQTGTVTNAASGAVPSAVLDFTKPVVPTALTATTTAGVPGVVNLSWVDGANNETGFTVQRATNATFTAGLVSTTVPGAVAGTGSTVNYTLSGLTTGTKYYFRVTATNALGTSATATGAAAYATFATVGATGVVTPTLVTVP